MTDERLAEIEEQVASINRKWDVEAWSRRGAPDYKSLVAELLSELKQLRLHPAEEEVTK